ncbi:unnamed protein product [Linum tenue]|uniref:Uncharacterized protein n=1 Tax=Linum tenue TaxID=586396 RepID=A0AAV0NYJ0_9ROSI|nr:unnamed protein product [Linum tenue]
MAIDEGFQAVKEVRWRHSVKEKRVEVMADLMESVVGEPKGRGVRGM